MRLRKRLLMLVAVIALGAVTMGQDDCSSTEEDTGSKDSAEEESKGDKAEKKKPEKKDSCGSKATDDCTPHAGPGKTVEVDAMTWRILSAKTASSIGDTSIGLGEKANGVFIVVKLKVKSSHDESVTLSDDVISLDAKGNEYKPDTDGSVAAIGSGEEPFFLEGIGPDSTSTGTVVFDIPRKVLNSKPELGFGELGFGSTQGFIRLPPLG